MTRLDATIDDGDVEALILRSLVKKLVEKGLLSKADVRALLLDAVKGLDIVVHNPVTTTASNDFVIEGD